MESTITNARILLIGNPNAGKTMLFNRLTGLRARVANHPGITVEFNEGTLALPSGKKVSVVDLPGTYSLHTRSEDEEITAKGLLGQLNLPAASELLIAIVDATQLKRNLYLVTQLLDLRRPLIIALTMMDVAKKQKLEIDVARLSHQLAVPIVPLSSITSEGIDELKREIEAFFKKTQSDASSIAKHPVLQPTASDISKKYRQIDAWLTDVIKKPSETKKRAFGADDLFLHPFLGPLLLLLIFAFMFNALFSWSQPLVALVEKGMDLLVQVVKPLFPAESLFGSLVTDGIIAGVGSVIAFVPLIAVLFLFIGVLEDSGYLARATFLLDQLMSRVGLPGRAFVPLLSGFACAIPAILASRVIESKKDRLITILVTPLISCSARLPIYGLLIATVFSSMPPIFGFIEVGALVMLSMYALGITAAFVMAAIFKRFLFRGPSSSLILELPPYRMPRWSSLVQNVLLRVRIFLREAGTIILAMTVILWALFTFPRASQPESMAENSSVVLQTAQPVDGSAQLKESYAGRLGQFIEPVVAPLGFDWKIAVAVVASFAAREVLVSTLGIVYGLGKDENETSSSLRTAIRNDINPKSGKPVYTPLVALSLMVFFSLAMQCMSTLATTKKETKSWRWPLFQFAYMSVLAWVSSCALFQGASALGF